MKINIHAGHNPDGMIACGAVGLIKESTEARKIKDSVIEKLRVLNNIVYDTTVDNGINQTDVLRKIIKKCNLNDVDLDISIHLNSGRNDYYGDGITAGTEVWVYPGNKETLKYAENIVNCLAELGFKNRGVKTSKSLYYLNHTNANAILIEVCFVDDMDDVDVYNISGIDLIANAIVKGITGETVSKHPDGLSDEISNDGNWYFYTNGQVNESYTGLAKNKNGWFYVKNGKVDFSYNGFDTNEYGTWYVEKGNVSFKTTDVIKDNNGTWWNVVKSKVEKGITVAKNNNGWWYIDKEGKVDFTFNGLAQNENGIWVIEKGKVNFNYNGPYCGKIVCNITKGKLD